MLVRDVVVLARVIFFFPLVANVQLFLICDENSVDNTGLFILLLSRAYTEAFSAHSRPFLLLPTKEEARGEQRMG